MVRFRQKLDRNNKVYIPKPLRELGLVDVIEIKPNTHAAVMYPAGLTPLRVIQSLKVIIQHLQLEAEDLSSGEEADGCISFPVGAKEVKV